MSAAPYAVRRSPVRDTSGGRELGLRRNSGYVIIGGCSVDAVLEADSAGAMALEDCCAAVDSVSRDSTSVDAGVFVVAAGLEDGLVSAVGSLPRTILISSAVRPLPSRKDTLPSTGASRMRGCSSHEQAWEMRSARSPLVEGGEVDEEEAEEGEVDEVSLFAGSAGELGSMTLSCGGGVEERCHAGMPFGLESAIVNGDAYHVVEERELHDRLMLLKIRTSA